MATRISEECIACGACESECPNDAIGLGDEIFVIDPELCSECVGFSSTQKCQEACPVDCCVPDLERMEPERELFERALRICAGREPAPVLGDQTSHFRAS